MKPQTLCCAWVDTEAGLLQPLRTARHEQCLHRCDSVGSKHNSTHDDDGVEFFYHCTEAYLDVSDFLAELNLDHFEILADVLEFLARP